MVLDIGVAEIVGENDDDVRLFGLRHDRRRRGN
jgi:hypothetical protein